MPRLTLLARIFLLALAIVGCSLLAIQPRAQQEVLPSTMLRSLFAPYYSSAGGYSIVLTLNNTTKVPITATPTIYSPGGRAKTLADVPLRPHEFKMVPLDGLLVEAGEEFGTGSMRLDYVGTGFGLSAHVMLVDSKTRVMHDFMFRPKSFFRSSRLEGIWWNERGRKPMAAVANTVDQVVTGVVTITGKDGTTKKSIPLVLQPHQSAQIPLTLIAGESSGGVSVAHDGPPGALMAEGYSADPSSGFSAPIRFTDPSTRGTNILHGAGLLFGADPLDRKRKFSARLFLRNSSLESVLVIPFLVSGKDQIGAGKR